MTDEQIIQFFYGKISCTLEKVVKARTDQLLEKAQLETEGLPDPEKIRFWQEEKRNLLEEFKNNNPLGRMSRLDKAAFAAFYDSKLWLDDLKEKYSHPVWKEDYITDRAHFYKYAELISFINRKLSVYLDKEEDLSASTAKTLGKVSVPNTITIDRQFTDRVFKALQHFFPEDQRSDLLRLIHGEEIDDKLLFQAAAVRLIYVFTRLKFNGYIVQSIHEIGNWICENLHYLDRKSREIKPFKYEYCVKVLSKRDIFIKQENIIPVDGLTNIRSEY